MHGVVVGGVAQFFGIVDVHESMGIDIAGDGLARRGQALEERAPWRLFRCDGRMIFYRLGVGRIRLIHRIHDVAPASLPHRSGSAASFQYSARIAKARPPSRRTDQAKVSENGLALVCSYAGDG